MKCAGRQGMKSSAGMRIWCCTGDTDKRLKDMEKDFEI